MMLRSKSSSSGMEQSRRLYALRVGANCTTLSMRKPGGEGVVNVAKLCIEIPDSLLKWLKEISKEMDTKPGSLIPQYL